MKKFLAMALILVIAVGCVVMAGCGESFNADGVVTVITRETGSGTRGAFIELTGLEVKGADGTKSDTTKASALVQESTGAVLNMVKGNVQAIGYISMGSLNDTVKALKVEGVAPTTANVSNGTYKLSRPFMIAVNDAAGAKDLVVDFMAFIMSKEGQQIVSSEGYVAVNTAASAFTKKTTALSVTSITVGGSSSVSPLMTKLIEGYKAIYSNVSITLQTTDSGTGMTNAAAGSYDIGMASRELKTTESAKVTGTKIADDGIAVIVHKTNTLTDITVAKLKSIYDGSFTKWSDVLAQ